MTANSKIVTARKITATIRIKVKRIISQEHLIIVFFSQRVSTTTSEEAKQYLDFLTPRNPTLVEQYGWVN